MHGHNREYVETCARFIEKLDLKVVILDEQSNRSQSLMEKLESHSDVSYAVVLLTADDRGGTASTGYEGQQPRARQNAIFELGDFCGAIGRGKVCALYQNGVELPSDFVGIAYVSLDLADWKTRLARELKDANLPVDLNKI